MPRVDVQIPTADGRASGTLHVPDSGGLEVPDNTTYDKAASDRHWTALGQLYQSAL